MAGRYAADQNKVLGFFESGGYATGKVIPSGGNSGSVFWIGEVTDHSIDDAEGLIESRYMGTATRSFDSYNQGPQDVTGTLTYNAVDMRIPFWAIGSVVEVSGTSVCTHNATEVESDVCQNIYTSGTGQSMDVPMSFTIEDSKQAPGTSRNFIRTVAGACLNKVTIAAKQSEKVSVDVDYIGQSLAYTPSGTTTTIVDSGTTPYMWSDGALTLGGHGTNLGSTMDTAKEFSLVIDKKLIAEHYIGSSTLGGFHGRLIAPPTEGNRDYTLSVTMDLPSDDAFWLYDQMYKGGSSFNATIDMNRDVTDTGSQHSMFIMSGCFITSMDNPSTVEGLNETTLEIKPQHVTGSSWDSISNYNPWIPD